MPTLQIRVFRPFAARLLLGASVLACLSGCRGSTGGAQPGGGGQPAFVFLQRGSMAVFATSDRFNGDQEEVIEVLDVSPDEVKIRYTSQSATKDHLEQDFSRFLRRVDLANAHAQFLYRSNRLPERLPGTTSFGPSAEVIRELKAKGRTEFEVYLGRPNAPKNRLSVDELLRRGLLSRFSGVLSRVPEAGPADPVLVNGDPVTFPAIHAKGVLTNGAGDQIPHDFWFLDDPVTPITLKSSSSAGDDQLIKIFTTIDGRGANAIDRKLTVDGRADVYGMFFDFGEAALRPESETTLAEIAEALRSHQDWKLSIEGHTDNVGADEANQLLSERRANNVKDALVDRHHIDPARLSASGLGESRPKATNDTFTGRAANRRVELRRSEQRAGRIPASAGEDRPASSRLVESPQTVGAPGSAEDAVTAWILSLRPINTWLVLVALGWVSLTVPVALFLLIRWLYLRSLRGSLYGPGAPLELQPEPALDAATTRPSIRTGPSERAVAGNIVRHPALVAALAETRRTRAAYACGGIAYLITAAWLIWSERSHSGIHSTREVIYVTYVTTAPSVTLILASLRTRAWQNASVAAGWVGCLAVLLVGVFRVPWFTALHLLATDADPLALFPIAVNAPPLLRTTRAMLVLLVPLMICYGLAAGAMVFGVEAAGLDFTQVLQQGLTVRSVVGGLAAGLAGLSLAVMQIRAGVRSRSIAVQAAVAAIGLVGWPRLPFVAIAAVPLNALHALAVWWLFKRLVQLKARGYLTDDLLHFSTCWFLLLYFIQSFSGTGWFPIPSAMLPFVAYSLVLVPMLVYQARTRRAVPQAPMAGLLDTRPRHLLMLRVFGAPRIHRRLLDTLDDTWRHVGRVDLVVGVDVALQTLGPGTLENFLRGIMSRQFLGTQDEARQRLQTLPERRAADGLYPLNELHCLPPIWPDVVNRLASEADVVLLDLRGLRAANRGALFELALAVHRVPLARIVLLVDRHTDDRAVSEAIERAWSRLPADSPNAAAREPQLHRVACAGSAGRQDQRIADAVFAASFGAPHAPGPGAVPVSTASRPAFGN